MSVLRVATGLPRERLTHFPNTCIACFARWPVSDAGGEMSTASLLARCGLAESRIQARLQALFEAAYGGASFSHDPDSVNGLRNLAQLLLRAKSPLYDVDIALDMLVNGRSVTRRRRCRP